MPRAQGAFALPIDLIVSQRSVPKENGGALRAHTAEEHEITTCTRYARGILKCTGVYFMKRIRRRYVRWLVVGRAVWW